MTSAGLRIQLDRDQTIGRRITIILFITALCPKGIDIIANMLMIKL